MDLKTQAEMLHKVPMFSKLELSKLKLVAFTSELCTYEGGEVLFEAGDAADSAYVIMEGAAEVVVETEAGRWWRSFSAGTRCSASWRC